MQRVRPVGEPDVARRARDRHRHDGRRRRGDGRERLPPAVARTRSREGRSTAPHVVLEAAREVANPIAFAILIIIVVFLPLFSLTGLEGKLFKPMALTITFAMAGSLLLTLTLVPVLASLDPASPRRSRTPGSSAVAKRLYLPLLDWALERKKIVVGGGAGAARRRRSRCSRSSARSSCRTCRRARSCSGSTGIPSTSLEESIRVANGWTPALRKQFPQTKSVLATIGRAEKGETADANYMEVLRRREDRRTSGRERMTMAALVRGDAGRISEERSRPSCSARRSRSRCGSRS